MKFWRWLTYWKGCVWNLRYFLIKIGNYLFLNKSSPVSKTGVGATLPGVQIPLSPPLFKHLRQFLSTTRVTHFYCVGITERRKSINHHPLISRRREGLTSRISECFLLAEDFSPRRYRWDKGFADVKARTGGQGRSRIWKTKPAHGGL